MKTQVDLNSIYAPSKDVMARDMHGEFLIIPVASGVGDMDDAIFSLNKFGAAIWEKMDSKASLKEIIRALSSQFKGDAAEIEKDVLGLTKELLKRKMIIKV